MPWHGPDGARLYYEDTGRGDPVVLMPGWGGSIIELNGLRATLAEGFRIVAIDLPGSGRSQPQPRHYPASYYADDAQVLLGLLDELGIGAAHLAGFSDGGEEALLLAVLRPSLALSVFTWGAAGQVVAPPGALESLAHAIDDPSPEVIGLAAYLTQAYGADGARVMTRTWAQAMSDIVAAGGNVSRTRAHLISCPALLITGSDDAVCPPDLVSELAGLIPRGEFREAHGAGHAVHQSQHGWLARQLGDWLAAH